MAQPQVTVDLAGDAPVTIDRVQVSALLFNQSRFTALRQFRIDVSSDGGLTYRTVLTSPPDAFPGFNPRPVAPELILREFRLSAPVEATHVRLVVLNNQCTGNPAFQGEQDADPLNTTDCRVGAGIPS
ncbi:MAG TPA: peptidase M36, partial [Actinomycetota bacterium]|nr:peptidase M36 [Actinomycetota bacterium]